LLGSLTDHIIAINVIVKTGKRMKKMSKPPWEDYSGDPDPDFEAWKLKYNLIDEGISDAPTTVHTTNNRSS